MTDLEAQEAGACGEGGGEEVPAGEGGGRRACGVLARLRCEQGEDGDAPVAEDSRIIRREVS